MSDAARLFAFRRSTIITASAGTGKTFTLTGVTVHLLTGGCLLGDAGLRPQVDPGRLVATTFSRKAAAEIRARVTEELERLSDPSSAPTSHYYATLREVVAETGQKPWEPVHVALRARRALEAIGRAEIGTLHGFARSIVARYALEIGFAQAPEIASDDDDARARERAVEGALGRAFERDPAMTRRLVDAAGGSDALVGELAATLVAIAEDGAPPEALVVDERDEAQLRASAEGIVDAARSIDTERLGPAAARLVAAFDGGDDVATVAALEALLASDKPRKRTDAEEALFELRDELAGSTNGDRARRFARAFRARASFTPAARAAREVLADAARSMREAELASGVLGFSSLLREARDLLRARPDVARELSGGYDALLVDECQDTSRLQRDLVMLLWARPSARRAGEIPGPGELRDGGLLLVGDRKQSIYGFRGADVGVFGELCVGLAGERARIALRIPPGLAWEPPRPSADFFSLRHNRRGEWELLEVANMFSADHFARTGSSAELFEIEYSPDAEDLLPPTASAAPPAARARWLRPRGPARPGRLDEARVIAARIEEVVAARAPLARTGSPPRWADVAILAHTNEMLDAAAFALAERRIPYVVAGRGFFAAREVQDLLAMLAHVLDPGDRLALLTVLRGPWASVSDRTLLALTEPGRGLSRPGPAWDHPPTPGLVEPADAPRIAALRAAVERLAPIAHRLGPGGVLREAVRELELEAVLGAMPRGAQRVANARKLVALADRYADGRELLADARRASARGRETEAATFSEDDDAVRLLTVHASKGLDFPIVFMPEVGRSRGQVTRSTMIVSRAPEVGAFGLAVRLHDGGPLSPPSYQAAVDARQRRDAAERQRLWYVAITRAAESMTFVGGDDAPDARTAAGTLTRLAARGTPFLEVEDVPVPEAPAPSPAPAPIAVVPPRRARLEATAAGASAAIAPTALSDFAACPRRFQLVHLLAFPEHPRRLAAFDATPEAAEDEAVPLDARREGTIAHRVLERVPAELVGRPEVLAEVRALLVAEGVGEDAPGHDAQAARLVRFLSGEYARTIAERGATLERERAIALSVRREDGLEVVLRGSIDLLVRWPDGSLDVVDYKRARGPSPEPYAFQLDVYALAVRELGSAGTIRTGVVFLGGRSPEPRWRAPEEPAAMRARVLDLATRLHAARGQGAFPRAPLATCERIVCGYVGRCHPERD